MAQELTVDNFLSLPRPQVALASPSGKRFVQSSSSFDLDKEKAVRSIHVGSTSASSALKQVLFTTSKVEAPAADATTASTDKEATEVKDEKSETELASLETDWLDDSTLLFLRSAGKEAKGIEVWARAVDGEGEYKIGEVPVKIGNLTINARTGKSALLVFSASVYPSEPYLNKVEELAEKAKKSKRGATGRIYDKVWVRHWDSWIGETKQHLFAVKLELKGNEWAFSGDFIAPFAGQPELECPVGAFGGADDYAVSPDGKHAVFTAKNPEVNPAWHTSQHIYLVPFSPRNGDEKKPQTLTSGTPGATSSPTFSPDGKLVAWLQMKKDGYEADRNQIVIHSLAETRKITTDLASEWILSPALIRFSADGKHIFALTEEKGHRKIFSLAIDGKSEPKALTHKHAVTGFSVLNGNQLLVTQNHTASPNEVFVLDINASKLEKVGSLIKSMPHIEQIEEFWYRGAATDVHGFLLRPPGFQKGKKYPLCFWVHGGPQGAFLDAFNTRWCTALWAAQGYIVTLINPTGSTGYGQAFCDAIQDDWGGAPYKDLVAGRDFLLKQYPEIDAERTIAAGASYGGFMMNWFQAQNLKFDALVCHDGVYDIFNNWALYFPEREFGGLPWTNPDSYSRFNPRNHIAEGYNMPMFIIHNDKDYRLNVTEGLAMFNTLQRKGVPSRLLTFDDECHWVLNPLNSRMWHEEIFKWIKEWAPPGPR